MKSGMFSPYGTERSGLTPILFNIKSIGVSTHTVPLPTVADFSPSAIVHILLAVSATLLSASG
jgi:hypothetical protein